MALGDPYCTLADVKAYMKISNTTDDALFTSAIVSATAEIEDHCGRQFNLAAAASARVFEPVTWKLCKVDDFASLDGVTVYTDQGGIGDFSNFLDPTLDYEASPYNAMAEGVPWVYTTLRSTGGNWFPKIQFRRRATVQVTAVWGWASVPAPVTQACIMMAAQEFRMKDAPLGMAGMTEFGTPVKVVSIPKVEQMLCKYRRYPALAA